MKAGCAGFQHAVLRTACQLVSISAKQKADMLKARTEGPKRAEMLTSGGEAGAC
jgi:hypothetical protein